MAWRQKKGRDMNKVLIVDDSPFMRKVLKDILPRGCHVFEADSGPAAMELFKKEHPDLVLLDIIMPGEEEAGIGVLQALMKTDPGAKVIVISALGQDVIVEQCRSLGARDYITKPFDDRQVRETVERYLAA